MQGQRIATPQPINKTRWIIDFKKHVNQSTFEPEPAVLNIPVLLLHSIDGRAVLLSCLDEREDIRGWKEGAEGLAAGPRLFTFRKGKAA